jgi:small-conductance mechanosensitive channel
MIKKQPTYSIFAVFILVIIFLASPLGVSAQTIDNVTPKDLDNKVEVIKIKQDNQDTLNTSVAELEKQNNQLEKDIVTLQATEVDLNTTIKKNETSLEQLNKLATPTPNQTNQVESTTLTIKNLNEKKDLNKLQITEKQSKIDTNRSRIADTKEKAKNNQNELAKEINGFQNDIFVFVLGISKYIFLIIFYWIILQGIRYLNNKIIPNETVRNIIALILTFLAIFATFITIFIAFAGNTTYLGPTLGVFSAALVVALQDFIASFFAWVVIKARGPYKINDTIEIPTPSGLMTGVVTQVGFFRTRIREKIGGESRDREQFTGKTIFFPNNLILKQGFRNFTFDNKILWHSIVITVTFESDFEIARKSLEDIIHKQFHYMVDHKDIYLDDVYNLKHIYKPKIYLHIANYGPEFTIWVPARLGTYREISEKISLQILKDFKHNEIELAYPTSRIVRREDLDRNYTEFDSPHSSISH